ncbi:MAG TPA: PQQ-dependent sugar dehydrogenase [Candidatus Saccharimonadales bacterium]
MIGRRFSHKTKLIILSILIGVTIIGIAILAVAAMQKPDTAKQSTPVQPKAQAESEAPPLVPPTLKTEAIIAGLQNPWDVAFLPDAAMLVTERGGRIIYKASGEKERTFTQIADVRARGEGGLMGLEVDREFSKNSYIYTCFASTSGDVRLVRWTFTKAGLVNRKDIVTNIPLYTTGRHSGCRIKMDVNGVLWVGTGDAAQALIPQDPKSLGGKILRVTREGAAAPGNLGGQFDPRVYSYGHRNTQGIALYAAPKKGVAGFSVEHGPNIDDEVNKLVPGNFGWNPTPPYIENVPMTDKKSYPNAVDAVWSSGGSTIAPSGAAFLTGSKWKAWQGALAIAVLKGQQLRIQKYDANFKITQDDALFQTQFGRLRSATTAPDGTLYLTTDNSVNDQIIRVIPQ